MILDRFRMDGKVALVTGGTRGIGLGIAKALGEAGARVIVTSKTPNPEAMAELRATGAQVDYLQADMEDPAAPQQLIADALTLGGRIDALVLNHGISGHGDTATYSPEFYRKLMTTNVDSYFFCCQAVLAPMRRQGGGVIVTIGSMSGIISNIPQPQVAYNASKAAVHHMTKSLASDLAAENIRVNSVAPGYIDTVMTAPHFNGPEWGPTWKAMTPMARMGSIEEVAAAVLFLCSDASGYVTGTVLSVDGGYTAR
jgi:NAD(P)-dependent dehydrogenase (short-subunit alcohol dehydrogenase family)